MRYKLLYTNRAVKDLEKLSPTTKERIGESLERYAVLSVINVIFAIVNHSL